MTSPADPEPVPDSPGLIAHRFELDTAAAEAWEALNARPARDLPGLRRLMERPSPFGGGDEPPG